MHPICDCFYDETVLRQEGGGNKSLQLVDWDKSTSSTSLPLRTPVEAKGVCDEWSVDDGSVLAHQLLLLVLRSLQAPPARGASAGPRALAAQLAGRSSSGAAEAWRCSSDKRRRRTRRHAKRSMSVVSANQQHQRQEERHRQEAHPHYSCHLDFSRS